MAKTDAGIRKNGERPQNERYTQDEIIRMYDKWKAGEIREDEYTLLLIRRTARLADEMMKHWHVRADDLEDIREDCAEMVLRKFKNYDPRKSRVASFFTPQIIGTIRMHIHDNHTEKDIHSPHYLLVLKDMKSILAKRHLSNEPVSQYSVAFLMNITGGKYARSAIKGAIRAEQTDISFIEEDPDFENRGSWSEDPLRFVVEKEQHEMLVKVLRRLKPVELLTVIRKLDDETFKDISDYLNDHKDEYGITLSKVWPPAVQAVLMSGLSKMKTELELEDYIEQEHTHDRDVLMDTGIGDDEDDTTQEDIAESFGIELDSLNRDDDIV